MLDSHSQRITLTTLALKRRPWGNLSELGHLSRPELVEPMLKVKPIACVLLF